LAVPTKEQCVDANGKAQEQRRQGNLVAARAWLRVCVHADCPAVVRDDCTVRLDELERAQPTIALSVQAPDGSDLSEVVVHMDGATLTTRLDGSAMAVDIGQHTFQFEAEGYAPLSRTWIVVEGEKLRRERVTLQSLSAPTPADVPEAASQPADRRVDGGMGAQRVWGVVTGSVGGALLISSLAFGLVAASRWDAADKQCPTHSGCSPSATDDRDAAAAYATASTASLVTGGVLAALSVTLFLTAPRPARSNLALALTRGGLRLRGAF
ncbi:MAG TPA: hypothetical protein VFZ61_26055, partial [Polyangiales bacterium]